MATTATAIDGMDGDANKVGQEHPKHACPTCGREQMDMDGFGLLTCPLCDYCTHPSSTSDRHGNMVCGICGSVTGRAKRREHVFCGDGAGI